MADDGQRLARLVDGADELAAGALRPADGNSFVAGFGPARGAAA